MRIILSLFLALAIAPASNPAAALLPANDLEKSLQDWFDNAAMGEEARFGAFVADAQTGEWLAMINEAEGMAPASLVQLFTAAAALDTLGPNHQFRTTVRIAGEINEKGHLDGQIHIRGGGDPAFGPRFQDDRLDVNRILRLWASDMRDLGLRTFDGMIIGDDRLFTGEPAARGWDMTENGEWWSAEVSALTINDGCITVQWDADRRIGSEARHTIYPKSDYARFTSSVKIVSPDQPYIPLRYFRHATRTEQVARGNLPQGLRVMGWTAVEDPARMTAYLFAEELRAVKIKGEFRGASTRDMPEARMAPESEMREVLSYTSPPLSVYLDDILADSQNLYAECIARAIAIEQGQPASFEGASKAITQWAERKGMLRAGFALIDASGLSSLDLLPARSIGDLLLSQQSARPNARLFRDALAVAGEKGTLRQRLPEVSGRFQGKSGVLKDATSLAGYLRTQQGREYVVVLMVDRSTAPAASRERFLDALVVELDRMLSPQLTASR